MNKLVRGIINDFNIKKQAEDLGVSFWQTPSFLFIVMGIVIIATMSTVYTISKSYDSPEILILSEVLIVSVLFIIGNLIIKNVEEMAKANKMKSEFVSVASHQLKTPLSQISWKLELLFANHKEGLTEKQSEIIRTISQANEKMKRLVSDLLDVARIQQEKFFLTSEKVDVKAIVKNIVEEVKDIANAKGAKISISSNGRIPLIMGDKRKIELLVGNLISNSVKYIGKNGKIRIHIDKNKKDIITCVEDNGVGIPENQHDRVFTKFFRSDNVIKYQTEGTGLGLYIAKNIVEKSGGRIWFKSKENVGTTFCFSLPINNKKRKLFTTR